MQPHLAAIEGNDPGLSHTKMLSEKAFKGFQKLIFDSAGISMSAEKKPLIASRLGKRIRILNLPDYDAYYDYLKKGEGAHNGEVQRFIDLLTTNETYFYREPQHFEYLSKHILPNYNNGEHLRIWSAASSSGEEIYTMAMIIAESLGIGGNWEIIGTDISTRMIESARRAIYSDYRVRQLPKHLRHRYMLKGTGKQQGFVAVAPELRRHIRFEYYNLIESPPHAYLFDVIFCRNVLIYFNRETKQQVVQLLCKQLKNSSCLFTSHSESIHGMSNELKAVSPSVYQKIAGKA